MKKQLALLLVMALSLTTIFAQEATGTTSTSSSTPTEPKKDASGSDSRLSSTAFFTAWSGTNAAIDGGLGYETGMRFSYKAKEHFTLLFGGSYEYGNYDYYQPEGEDPSSDLGHFFIGGKFALGSGFNLTQLIGFQVGSYKEGSGKDGENFTGGGIDGFMEFTSGLSWGRNLTPKDFLLLSTSYAYDINNQGELIVNNSDGFKWLGIDYSRNLRDDLTFDVGLALTSFSSLGDDEFNISKITFVPSIGITWTGPSVSVNTFMFTELYIDTYQDGVDVNKFTFDIGGGLAISF